MVCIMKNRMSQIPPTKAAHLLRTERFKREWTQEQFAEWLGVEPQTISNWERGRISKMGRVLIKLLSERQSFGNW